MENAALKVNLRTSAGKGAARKVRANGAIPAVCYGRAASPLSLSVNPRDLKNALDTPLKRNTAITLTIDGAEKDSRKLVMVKDLQFDPVTHELLHADFYEIREDEQIVVNVPIVCTGKPKGAADGGILQQVTRWVQLRSLPLKVPASIEVDVSGLGVGQSVHIEDVKFPEGVQAKYDTNFTIAVVVVPQEEVVAKPVAVEGAPAEGAVTAEGAAG